MAEPVYFVLTPGYWTTEKVKQTYRATVTKWVYHRKGPDRGKRWYKRSYRKTVTREVERKKFNAWEAIRVTVGTGISVEKKHVISFSYSAVVLAKDVEETVKSGKKWINNKFKAVYAGLKGRSVNYGVDEMFNFDLCGGWLFPNEENGPADYSDLGKLSRRWVVDGVEYEED